MIRPNLRSFAAAVACMILAPSAASAQYGEYGGGGDPSMFHVPQSPYRPPVQDYFLPGNNDVWDESRPIERFVGDVKQRSWLKLEFLMWNYGGDQDLIGANVSGLQQNTRGEIDGRDTSIPLLDNLNGGTDIGEALFPFASALNNDDVAGIRGTWGLDLNGADMELSFFGLGQSSSTLTNDDISASRVRVGLADPVFGTTAFPNIAVPLLTDGTPGTPTDLNALIFTESFSSHISTQMWGTEIAFLTDRSAPGGSGASWQWLGGFRYLNLDEQFGFSGTSVGTAATSVAANTINNYFGPQVGGRAALTSKYLTLSATPRVMLGLNDNTSRVGSSIAGVAGTQYTTRDVDFGTVTQLNMALELHLSPQFSMYGGYDYMWLTGVSRPYNNILYDSTLDGTGARVADIRQKSDVQNLIVNGFSIGATFRY